MKKPTSNNFAADSHDCKRDGQGPVVERDGRAEARS
jgi:hypothetical protein